MKLKFIDLFCGIGGFRFAAHKAFADFGIQQECVFSSDIDVHAQKAYEANFGELPSGDITKINPEDIPSHDILFAGFPCQPFSIIGKGRGFEDARGTLFFNILKILEKKTPKVFVLENVKQLVGHDGGRTLKRILEMLRELGYRTDYKVLNALDLGLPQKRERIVIVGFLDKNIHFVWPEKLSNGLKLEQILEKKVDKKHFASERIRQKRHALHTSPFKTSIWHENKSGNISSYPYSCALRANASYNYLLVNGERRLTPREMLRLQGFPDSFKIVVPDSQTRKQAGNAVPVNIIESVLKTTVLPQLIHISDLRSNKKVTLDFYVRPQLATA